VKYYASSFGTPTAARGWVEGGTVKDDDLVHKFADISEPITTHLEYPIHPVSLPTKTATQEYGGDEVERYNEDTCEPVSENISNIHVRQLFKNIYFDLVQALTLTTCRPHKLITRTICTVFLTNEAM
jgi:hypothetical protein